MFSFLSVKMCLRTLAVSTVISEAELFLIIIMIQIFLIQCKETNN